MIYKRHPDIAWREVAEESLVVDPRTGRIFPLNPVSSFIWKKLDGFLELGKIREEIEKEFDVGAEEAEQDLNQFVEELKEADLILQQ